MLYPKFKLPTKIENSTNGSINKKVKQGEKRISNKKKRERKPLYSDEPTLKSGKTTIFQDIAYRDIIDCKDITLENMFTFYVNKINQKVLRKTKSYSKTKSKYEKEKVEFESRFCNSLVEHPSTISNELIMNSKHEENQKPLHNKIRGTIRKIVDWIIFEKEEDYSHLIRYIKEEISRMRKF